MALYWLVFGAVCKKFLKTGFSFMSLSFIWVILEWIRTAFGGFGWVLFGYSQYQNVYLIQAADIFGVWIVSFLIISSNIVIFKIVKKRNKTELIKAAVFISLLSSAYAYGYLSLKTGYLTDRDKVEVSIIQPNIEQYMKWDPYYYEYIKNKLVKLGRKAPEGSLVIFPEASWPRALTHKNEPSFKEFTKQIHRDFLIGAVIRQGSKFYNTSILSKKDSGKLKVYRKIKLVPFGEYVPFRKYLPFISVINQLNDISRGTEYTLFNYHQAKIANLICFEDIFAGLVAGFVEEGANILVNITNDAWFKGNPQSRQHLQVAVFRAVESRKSLVRVANTGISCIILPTGKILNKLTRGNKEVFIEGALFSKVPLVDGKSFYVKNGNFFVFIGIFYIISESIVILIRRRKRKR